MSIEVLTMICNIFFVSSLISLATLTIGTVAYSFAPFLSTFSEVLGLILKILLSIMAISWIGFLITALFSKVYFA